MNSDNQISHLFIEISFMTLHRKNTKMPYYSSEGHSSLLSSCLIDSAHVSGTDSCRHCKKKQKHNALVIESVGPNGVCLALDSHF